MSNIVIDPSSGIIEFNTGSANGDSFDNSLLGASRLEFKNSGQLSLTSLSTGVSEKFTVDGLNGRLFTVDNEVTGSIFSINDAAGLPIVEVFSDDRIIMGQYATDALVISGSSVQVTGSNVVTEGHLSDENYVTSDEILTHLLTVDGANSNLDADKLDGQQGSYYLDYSNFSSTPTVNDVSETNLLNRLAALDSSDTIYIGDAGDDTTVVVRGTLQVDGSTTTINSNTLSIGDNQIVLNNDVTGTPTQNAGITVERGTATNASLIWDESNDYWKAGLAGSEVQLALTNGTYSGLRAQSTTKGDVGLGNVTNESKATMFASPSFTGDVVITDDTFPFIRSATNGAGAGIKFSDQTGYGQYGTLKFVHSDGASYGSGASFILGTSEASTTILADGKLMYGEGIYSKPASGTGAGTRKDSNWDTAYTHTSATNNPHSVTASQVGAYTSGETDTLLAAKAPLASPALTGNPTAPTQSSSENSTKIATTAYVKSQGYVTSSGNTIIGTDSDINTSGATVVDQLNMTDGVIQSHSTRTLTLANLGYTGATNANYITNNNQLTNGASYITGNQTITLSGDVSGSGTTSISVTVNDDSHNHTGLLKRADIGSSVNLNGYTTDGYYHQNGNAGASSGSNYPEAKAGMLTVQADGVMVYQKYQLYNGTGTYHRSYYNGTWYAWRRLFADNHHPNADTLTTARTIALGGDVTGSASFNGGSNITINASLSSGSVGASEIAANAVGSSEIATNAVTSAKIAADAVGASEIAANAVGSSEIADGAVTAIKLATNSVTATKIAGSAVGASELNVVGNGSTSQFLRSDGDGTFTWATPTDTNTVYTHPTHAGDDINIDTGALTGATVISDLDFNVTTDGLGHVTDANGTVSTRTLTAANLGISAPNAPASASVAIVGETVEVTFAASTTSNIDAYLVYSSIDGSDYGLISVVPPDDFAASMSIIDNAFDETGTQAYRVYAMKYGILSSAATDSVSYTVSSAEPTSMSVVNLNNAYYVQWNPPSSNARFVTAYNVYKHEHAVQGSLSRSSASLVYSGMNTNYMYQISGTNNNNFHQFWVETTIA